MIASENKRSFRETEIDHLDCTIGSLSCQ